MAAAEDVLQDPQFQALPFPEQQKVIDMLLEEEKAGAGKAALTSKAGVQEYGGPLNIPATWETAKEIGKASVLPLVGGLAAGAPGAMLGEWASQELGLAPKSLTQMLLAGIPEPAAAGIQLGQRATRNARARWHPELATALKEEAAVKGARALAAARPAGGTTLDIEASLQKTPEAAALARVRATEKLKGLIGASVESGAVGPGVQAQGLASKILRAWSKDPELQVIPRNELDALVAQLQGMAEQQEQMTISPAGGLARGQAVLGPLAPTTPSKDLFAALRGSPEYGGTHEVTTQVPGPPSAILGPTGKPFPTTTTQTAQVPDFPVGTNNLQALASQQADVAAALGQYVRRVGAVSTELQTGMPGLATFEDLHNLQRWASEALDGAEGIERGKLLQIRRSAWQDLENAALTPELKEANAAFAREQGIETMQRLMRQATTADPQGVPGLNAQRLLTTYDRRLADDELFARAFSPQEHQQLRQQFTGIAQGQATAQLDPHTALRASEQIVGKMGPAMTVGQAEEALGKTSLSQNLGVSQVMDKVEKAFSQSLAAPGGITGLNVEGFLAKIERLRATDPTLSAIPDAKWAEMLEPFVAMAAEQKKYKSGVGTLALPGMLSQLGGFAGYHVGGLPGALVGAGAGLAGYAAARSRQSAKALASPQVRASLLKALRGEGQQIDPRTLSAALQVGVQAPDVMLRRLNQGQEIPGLPQPPEEEGWY